MDNSSQDSSNGVINPHLHKGNLNSKLSSQANSVTLTFPPYAPNNFLETAKKKLRKLLYMWNCIVSMNYFHLEQMSCVLSLTSTQTWNAWHLYNITNGLGFRTEQTFGLQTIRSTIITLSSFLLSRSKHFIKFFTRILPINILVILATIFRCAVNILGKLMDALSHSKQPLTFNLVYVFHTCKEERNSMEQQLQVPQYSCLGHLGRWELLAWGNLSGLWHSFSFSFILM